MRTQTAWLAFFAMLLLVKLAQANNFVMRADTPPPAANGLKPAAPTILESPDKKVQDDGCPDNCEKCDDKKTCQVCKDGFFLDAANNKCEGCKVNNCKGCSKSVDTCEKCIDGYKANSQKKVCDPSCKIDHCTECATASTCKTCSAGFKPNSQQKVCDPTCKIDHCTECPTASTCKTCSTGFKVSTKGKACVKTDGASRVSGPLFFGIISTLGMVLLF